MFIFDLQRFDDVSTVNELKSALTNGGDIKLSDSFPTDAISDNLIVGENATLDLNGKTLNLGDKKITVSNGKTFTLNDSGTTKGKITGTSKAIEVGTNGSSKKNDTDPKTTFNMEGVNIETTDTAITVSDNSEVNITNGCNVSSTSGRALYFYVPYGSNVQTDINDPSNTVGCTAVVDNSTLTSSGKKSAIQVSGTVAGKPVKIDIRNGSTIAYTGTNDSEENKDAIYCGGVADVTISGSETKVVSTYVGIEMRAGALTVENGKIASNAQINPSGEIVATTHQAEEIKYAPADMGATFRDGAAIAVAQHTPQKNISVNIKGGEISGYTALAVANPNRYPAFGSNAIKNSTDEGYLTKSDGTNANANNGITTGEDYEDGNGKIGTVTVDVTGGTLTSSNSKATQEQAAYDTTTKVYTLTGKNAIVNLDERVTVNLSGTTVEGSVAATTNGRTGTGYNIGEGNEFSNFVYDENNDGIYSYQAVEGSSDNFSVAKLAPANWTRDDSAGTEWKFLYRMGTGTDLSPIATLAPVEGKDSVLAFTVDENATVSNIFKIDLTNTAVFSNIDDYTVLDASAANEKFALDIKANDKITSILGGDGDDTLTAGTAGTTLEGGNGDDNLIGGSGNDMFVITKGSDTIANYDAANDNVSIGAELNAPTSFDKVAYTNGNFVISLSEDNDSLTVENTSEFSLTKDASNTYYYKANSAGIESIAKNTDEITLGAGFTNARYDGSKLNYTAIDAQAVTVAGGLKITGNDEDSTLIGAATGGEIKGGYGDDELQAKATNDTVTTILDGDIGNDLLKGSEGADTFVYSAGKDSIQNYAAGDLVSIKGLNPADAAYSVRTAENNTNISLNFGSDDLLVFENVINDGVSLKGSGGNYIYTKDYYALTGKGITLAADYANGGNFDASSDEKYYDYATINAAAVKKAEGIFVTGNSLNNVMFGSTVEGGTLYGGTGNDKLDVTERKNGKNFVFKYTEGKDTIDGFVAGDKLEIDDTLVAGITGGKASDGKLAFTFNNKSNVLTFLSEKDDLNAVALQSNSGYLTKDGVVTGANLKLFSNAKGRIDLTDAPYKDANINAVDARAAKNQSVTLVGGTQGGNFTFAANNRKKDMFEYGGNNVTISGYEAGTDRLNLGASSISSFEITNNNADVKLTVDSDKVISLVGAAKHEVLIHDANSKSNSYSKLVFYDNGVLHNKERRPTEATISAANTTYSAADLPSIKKIFVTDNVSDVNITAGNNKTTLDASEAGTRVTLTGGAKNDKFIASKGDDTFVYSAGKDVINGYTSSDIITLDGDELKMENAKITSSKKSLKFKFSSKNALAIKSDDTISSVQIGGGTYSFDKNAIISGGNVSLTSQFSGTFKTDDKDLSTNATYVDGERVTKNLTFKGTTANETLVGGEKKTTFKGSGGVDSLSGGSGKDIFFYAKGDSGTSTIANFDFTTDKIKIANGTLGKISTVTGGGVQFDMTSGKKGDISTTGSFKIASSATYTGGEYTKSNTFTNDKVLIKANNTYYWFAEAAGTDINDKSYASGALITHDTKISKATANGYAVIDLGYSTNLVKSGIAVKVASTGENAVSLPEKN